MCGENYINPGTRGALGFVSPAAGIFPRLCFALLTLALASPAHASFRLEQDRALPRTKFDEKPPGSSKLPVILDADQIDYDHENNIIIATGNVEVGQGDTVMLADKVTYYQDDGRVVAQGDIRMLEESGNVYFADELELQDDFKEGVIKQLKVRLNDDSLLAANVGKRIDENTMELVKTVYSPCKLGCADGDKPPPAPMWQIESAKAVIDQKAQEVVYDDAYFDVYGVPILYMPYMSHPTPGADNQSGLLTPAYEHNQNVGSVVKVPVFYSISRDKDLTITPIYTSQGGNVLQGDYREMFNEGQFDINGSITSAPNVDALGNDARGHEIRADINTIGNFRINQTYDWGFDAHRVTDDTYLERYGFGNETLLTSKIFVEGANFEGANNRSYAIMQGLSFQGLTAQTDSKAVPAVAPLIDATFQSDPGWENSRFTFDGDAMSLYRQLGDESRRLSGTAGWKIPYISDDGEVIEFDSQLRGDMYNVTDVAMPDGTLFNGTTGRLIPQASVMWRDPFITRSGEDSFMIEPIVNLVASPGGGNPDKIPNEDSQVPEFTDTNLFASDRFAGLDRVESGPRLSYGMRGQAQVFSDKYIDWLFGQQYRVINDPNFPISNDLTSHFSDYVGKIGVNYLPFSVAYRFRLDKDNFAPKRSEVDANIIHYPFNFTLSYLSLKDDPILANKEAVVAAAAINLTREWMWNTSINRDLLSHQYIGTGTGLTFRNECVDINGQIGRSYTELEDVKPSTNILFRISFKNLE